MNEAIKNLVVLVWTFSALNAEPETLIKQERLIKTHYSQSVSESVLPLRNIRKKEAMKFKKSLKQSV